MEKEMHIETINEVKRYMENKDYQGLEEYIVKREIEVNLKIENEASNYIENLINNLN